MSVHDESEYAAADPYNGPLSIHARFAGLALFALCAVITGTLAVYFVSQDTLSWREMNGHLLLGTVATAVAVFVHASMTFSFNGATSLLAVSCSVGLLAEYAGVQGWTIFGATYQYHQDLAPRIAGVPLFIPLAWFVLSYAPLVFLRRFSAQGGSGMPGLLTKAFLCALALTATDLYLDPLATSVAAWTWSDSGAYFGVPLGNYLGWFMVGMTIYTFHSVLTRRQTNASGNHVFVLDCLFVGLSVFLTVAAWMALSRHLNSMLPVAIAAGVTIPYWLYWWLGLWAATGARRPSSA